MREERASEKEEKCFTKGMRKQITIGYLKLLFLMEHFYFFSIQIRCYDVKDLKEHSIYIFDVYKLKNINGMERDF